MQVVPGIDLMDGKCVCPVHMPFAEELHFSPDPAEIAAKWAAEGARRLYLADLDGARMGQPRNLSAVKQIVKAGGIPVDVGGGIRTIEMAERVLDAGADRLVVGTSAALNEALGREMFASFGDRVILSVPSLNGYVAVRNWQARTDERAEDFARRMVDLGARRIAFTDVTRKGMRGGININAIRRMAEKLTVPLIASGGVSSMDDILELKALEPLGIEGVVVVTAIYTGAIKLREAIELAES